MGNDTALCALGVRYKFGTTEGEKEWLSGFYATPNEALGFFEFLVGIQAVTGELGSIPTAPTKPQETKAFLYAESAFRGSISNWPPPITPAKAPTALRCDSGTTCAYNSSVMRGSLCRS